MTQNRGKNSSEFNCEVMVRLMPALWFQEEIRAAEKQSQLWTTLGSMGTESIISAGNVALPRKIQPSTSRPGLLRSCLQAELTAQVLATEDLWLGRSSFFSISYWQWHQGL